MEKKYIPVIPGNIKGADDARTDILTLLDIDVDPMSNPEVNDGRMSEPVAAFQINGKMYDLKSVLSALAEKIGEGGGGEEAFTATYTLSAGSVTCDKTYSEVLGAITENKKLDLKLVDARHTFPLYVSDIFYKSNPSTEVSYFYLSTLTDISSTTASFRLITHKSTTISYNKCSYTVSTT